VIGIRGKPYSAGEKTSNKFDKFLADTAGFAFRFFDAIEKKSNWRLERHYLIVFIVFFFGPLG
jgi:hypothetical protein